MASQQKVQEYLERHKIGALFEVNFKCFLLSLTVWSPHMPERLGCVCSEALGAWEFFLGGGVVFDTASFGARPVQNTQKKSCQTGFKAGHEVCQGLMTLGCKRLHTEKQHDLLWRLISCPFVCVDPKHPDLLGTVFESKSECKSRQLEHQLYEPQDAMLLCENLQTHFSFNWGPRDKIQKFHAWTNTVHAFIFRSSWEESWVNSPMSPSASWLTFWREKHPG